MRALVPQCRKTARGAAAASFVELLVAVAVLSVLFALLYPTFQRAAAASKSVACMNQLRQIGAAAHRYMAENNQMIPHRANSEAKGWMHLIAPYLHLDPETDTQADIFRCPADPSKAPRQPRTYKWNLSRNKPGGSVSVGSYTLLQLPTPARLSLISNPATHAMIFDIAYTGSSRFELWKNNNNAWGDTYDLSSFPPGKEGSPFVRPHHHDRAVNILYYDGHVGVGTYPLPPASYYWEAASQ